MKTKISFKDYVIAALLILFGMTIGFIIPKVSNALRERTGIVKINAEKDTVFVEYTRLKSAVKHTPTFVRDSVLVDITVFNPTVKQCGKPPRQFTCADGSIIDPLNPQRWCGISKDLQYIAKFGDSIDIKIPNAPYLDGKWAVHTATHYNKHKVVDLLISNPIVCNIKGSWRGCIYYIRNDTSKETNRNINQKK